MTGTNFSTEPSRRRFFKTSLLTGAAAFAAPSIVPASVFGAQAPSNRIQIGAIGVGRISREHDLPEIMAFDQARVVAVCDLDSKRLQQGQAFVESGYAKKG
ncbi:gfo/Idh/MocA family oxidoreductase, partial [bacterium]|nr:gfo/Idh/MocA family oxidoreductase [bacterium]